MKTHFVDALSQPVCRSPHTAVDGLVCDVVGMLGVLADVAIDLLSGCLEWVRVATLDDIDSLVRQAVCTSQDGGETHLDGLRELVSLRTNCLSREVRRLGVCVVDEGGMEGSKRVADEGD